MAKLSEAARQANKRYDDKATVQIHLKLNKNTDYDILARLNVVKLIGVEGVQSYIKRLIRNDIGNVYSPTKEELKSGPVDLMEKGFELTEKATKMYQARRELAIQRDNVPPDQHPLFDLAITAQVKTALRDAGYTTVEQVMAASASEILSVPRIGLASYQQIEMALQWFKEKNDCPD